MVKKDEIACQKICYFSFTKKHGKPTALTVGVLVSHSKIMVLFTKFYLNKPHRYGII